MYIYISEQVQKDAQIYQIEIIRALAQRIESEPSLFSLLFGSRFPYWIRRIDNLRLIASLELFGENRVLYFSHLLPRGGKEYRDFLADPKSWGQQNIKGSDVQTWLDSHNIVNPNKVACIPDSLCCWLERPILMQREDKVIYESKIWVDYFQKLNSSNFEQLQGFYDIVAHLVGAKSLNYDLYTTPYKNVERCTNPQTGYSVLFSRIRPQDALEREILFLLGAKCNAPTDIEIAHIGNELKLFGSQVPSERLSDSNLKKSDIARYARRSYPDFIVYDQEHWQTMQLEPNTNLALSGEEEELLHSMNFPAFINGRAGSGKSTMLHYAFAYYCDLYLKEVLAEGNFLFKPLFLTYSERLTEKARDTVERILKSYALYIDTSEQRIGKLDLLKECFQPFQAFLQSCLPPELVNKYNRSKYISFHKFKKRYDKAFTSRCYSAEVCWHVIRTYIKGYYFVDENQDYLSIDEYKEEIPTEHKKVSNEDFETIYNHIWKWYFNLCHNEQLWDDQDLARVVLKGIANGEILSTRYAAIFCDEAQDFTRVELQLILRLSVWSKYLLPRGVINSLPFAFAGDPLQTLNPTGFSWASFRANFYEKILTPLDPDNSRSLRCPDKLALHELRQNYRSPNSIVKFTNYIHLWRRVLFDITNLEPQEPWWTENGKPPQKGIMGINLTVQELKRFVDSGAIFLLPCDEGGELEFLQKSEILKEVFPCEEGQIPPIVYTSIGLKGLELSSIVVCFFGEYYSKHFGHSLQSLTNTSGNLHLEYFLNKLYVAVSRSTDYLAIIDTKNGDELLWEAATPASLAPWLERMRLTSSRKKQSELYLESWEQKISPLERSFSTTGTTQDNFQTNAKKWLLSGIENNDIRNLQTAIYYYHKDKKSDEVSYCKAWILRIEGKLQEAGCLFMELSALRNPDLNPQLEAWQCFWEGQCWQKLLDWTAKNPNSSETAWQPIIRFMLDTEGKTFSPDSISQFSTFLCNQDFWRLHSSSSTWQSVVERYFKTINYFIRSQQNIGAQHWKLWSEALEKIALTYGFIGEDTIYLAGQCLYRASYFQQAINLWEQQQRIDHIEYAVAKAQTVKPPENLKWLSQANMFTRVVQVWKENNSPITGDWESFLPLVREALKQTQEFLYLLDIETKTSRWSEAIALYRQQNFGDIEHLKIIACMAHDANFTPESVKKMESGQRSILSDFVTQAITLPTWKPTETRILEICVAIEKIGEFVPALQIFEGFIEAQQTPKNVRKFARERWLVVKGKQADFSENTGRNEDASRQNQKRNFFATKWGINLQELSLDVPTLPLSNSTTVIPNSGASNINIDQLRQELTSSLTELTESELKQLSHYINFLRYSRNTNLQ